MTEPNLRPSTHATRATTRAMRARAAIAALALLMGAPSAAVAQAPDKDPAAAADPARRARAKKLAQQATRKYNLGQYAEALDGYTRSYDTFPAPGLLFNIAQCHRGLGHHEAALRAYEAYLREKPNASNRALVQELIAEEDGLLRTERQAQAAQVERSRAEAARARAQAREAEERRAADKRAEDDRRSAALTRAPAPAGEPRRHRSVLRSWWFWTAVGAVAVAAGGSALYLDSQRETVLPGGSLGTHDQR
ncbi:MAG TPA: hypothetical protein VK698_03530 [Kofleriaceae bacterium]|nr:hypothetical protein [Kofleriaceae bacterium]